MAIVTTALVWLGVAVCGGIGAVLRFAVDRAVLGRTSGAFPSGTMVVNLSGAFVLGVLDGVVLPTQVALVVGTGVIGAYTTFSTWMFESQRLLEARQWRAATANVVLSIVGGVLLAAAGLWLGGSL